MNERDFDHIVNFAQDQLPLANMHRVEASGLRLLFLSDPYGVIEIRFTRKDPLSTEPNRGPIDKIGL